MTKNLTPNDFRIDSWGYWRHDTVCPVDGKNVESWRSRCLCHDEKPILRREYAATQAGKE